MKVHISDEGTESKQDEKNNENGGCGGRLNAAKDIDYVYEDIENIYLLLLRKWLIFIRK